MTIRAPLLVSTLLLVACGDDGGPTAGSDPADGGTSADPGPTGTVGSSGGTSAGSGPSGRTSAPADDTGPGSDESSTTSAGPAADGCKRGLAYGYHSPADLAALSEGVSWWYNWASQPDEGVARSYPDYGFEFTPMVWGASFDPVAIAAGLRPDATALLGFNEPNFFAQANLSAQQAAERWPQLEEIADAHDLALVSPAVNFCGGGCWDEDPFSYLQDFLDACDGCRVDAIGAHWYACDGPALEWYLGQLEQFGRPIWLTEFACADGADLSLPVQLAYMEDAIALLESNPRVERYAWFSGRTDAIPNVNLLAEDGVLTELGQLYVSAPAACDR